MKQVLRASGVLLLALTCGVFPPAAAVAKEPAPARSDRSYYLPMPDSTRLALSLYFPGNRTPPAPTLLVQTRYGRAGVFIDGEAGGYQSFVDAGYVVAVLDTRGSTASFGPREVDIGPDEARDMDSVVGHLASQPWSDGSVYVTGVSYMADTADVSTSRPVAALKGGVIREADFDVWSHLFFPGGVANDWFLQSWGDVTYRMDLGRSRDQTLDCKLRAGDCARFWPILQAVDEDDDFKLLRQALEGKRRWTADTYASTEFRDDVARNGFTLFASSPAAHLKGIRAQAKPVQYWGSWMDGGTAEAALARYRSAPEVPMEVWITANNHPNTVGADPLLANDRAPRPAVAQQLATMKDFLQRLRNGEPVERKIHYYVLGTGQFKQTGTWPPSGLSERFFAIEAGHALRTDAPARKTEVSYEVDFTASAGKLTRWSTQFGDDPDYRDRRAQDGKLLVHDSVPFVEDLELVGTPVLRLQIATRTADPALHVYLEDVAPNGYVTYLTEGLLRLVNRKPAEPDQLPYDQGPAPHSFRRDDALPVVAGEFADVEMSLFPIAALVRKGHRLRLAIAGADIDTFRRYSRGEPESFRIRSTPAQPSGIAVTVRRWVE